MEKSKEKSTDSAKKSRRNKKETPTKNIDSPATPSSAQDGGERVATHPDTTLPAQPTQQDEQVPQAETEVEPGSEEMNTESTNEFSHAEQAMGSPTAADSEATAPPSANEPGQHQPQVPAVQLEHLQQQMQQDILLAEETIQTVDQIQQQYELEQLNDRRYTSAGETLHEHCRRGKATVYNDPDWNYEQEPSHMNPVPQLRTSAAYALKAQPQQRDNHKPLSRSEFYNALLAVNHQPNNTDLFKTETRCSYTFLVAAHMYWFYGKYKDYCYSTTDVWVLHMQLCQYYLHEIERDQNMLERLSTRVEQAQTITVPDAMQLSSTLTYKVQARGHTDLNIPNQLLLQFHHDLVNLNMAAWGWAQFEHLLRRKMGFAAPAIKALLAESPLIMDKPGREQKFEDMLYADLEKERQKLRNDLIWEGLETNRNAQITVPPQALATDVTVLRALMHCNALKQILSEQNPTHRLTFSRRQAKRPPGDTANYTPQQRNRMTANALQELPSRVISYQATIMSEEWKKCSSGPFNENKIWECAKSAASVKRWKQTVTGIEYLDESRPLLFSAFNMNNPDKTLRSLISKAAEFTREHTPELFSRVLLPAMSETAIRLLYLKVNQQLYTLMIYAIECRRVKCLSQCFDGLYKQRGLLHQVNDVLEYFLVSKRPNPTPLYLTYKEMLCQVDRLRSVAYDRPPDPPSTRPGFAPGNELELSPPVTDTAQIKSIQHSMKRENRPQQSNSSPPDWDMPHVPLTPFIINEEKRGQLPQWIALITHTSPYPVQDMTEMISLLAHLQRLKRDGTDIETQHRKELERLFRDDSHNREWVLQYSNLWPTNDDRAQENAKVIRRLADAAGRSLISQPITEQLPTDMILNFMSACTRPINYVPEVNLACHALQEQPISNDQYLMEQAITDPPGILRPQTPTAATVLSQAVPQSTCELNPSAPVPIMMRVELNHEHWTELEQIAGRPLPMLKAPLGQEQASALYSSQAKQEEDFSKATSKEWWGYCRNLERHRTITPGVAKQQLKDDLVYRLYTTPLARNKMCLFKAIHNSTMVGARALTQSLNYTYSQNRHMAEEICTELHKDFQHNNAIGLTLHTAPCTDRLRELIRNAKDKLHLPTNYESAENVVKKHLAQFIGYLPLHLNRPAPPAEDYDSFITMFVFACGNGATYIIPARFAVLENSAYELIKPLADLFTQLEETVKRRGPRWIMYQPEQSIDLFEKSVVVVGSAVGRVTSLFSVFH